MNYYDLPRWYTEALYPHALWLYQPLVLIAMYIYIYLPVWWLLCPDLSGNHIHPWNDLAQAYERAKPDIHWLMGLTSTIPQKKLDLEGLCGFTMVCPNIEWVCRSSLYMMVDNHFHHNVVFLDTHSPGFYPNCCSWNPSAAKGVWFYPSAANVVNHGNSWQNQRQHIVRW